MITEDEPEGLLTNEQLDKLAGEIPHVQAWLNAVEAEIQRALEEGHEFKNAKLVPKRATRKWTLVAADIIKRLKKFGKLDEVAPRVPLTPAVAEKFIGRKAFSELAATEVGGVRLVIAESSGMKVAYMKPAEPDE